MAQSLEERQAPDTLAAVAAAPFTQAGTIPPLFYRSGDVHALEMERIFARDTEFPDETYDAFTYCVAWTLELAGA